jgi:transcription antitermination factor NusG
MKAGEAVRMTGGPFFGIYGTVVSSSGDRVVLTVDLGSREVQVEIPRDWLVEVTPRH